MRRSFNRAEVAGVASLIGGAALVLAALVYLFLGEISVGVLALVIVSAAGIGLWMWWAPGELQAWLAGRQTRLGTTSVLITMIFIGFVAAGYILVDRANVTVDLTSVQRYTLDRQTLDTIDHLQERGFRVRIVGFFSRLKLREQEAADLLLRQYAAAGEGSIEVQYIDPDEQPDLAERYAYQPAYDGQLFLNVLDANGEPQTRPVTLAEGQTDIRYITLPLGDVNERDITTGLKMIASAGMFKIYFTVGHGERELSRVADDGISRLGVSLQDQGIGIAELNLSDVDRIPDDADAVLIIGARSEFTESEVAVLDEYIERGGRVAIFADPPLVETAAIGGEVNRFLEEGSPLNDYLWTKFGVRIRDLVVIETDPAYAIGATWLPVVAQIAPHQIMRNAEDVPIYMSFARPMTTVAEPDDQQARYVREPLFFSSELSWGHSVQDFYLNNQTSYDPATDLPGPVLTGVAIRRALEFQQDIQPRLVIIGDSDVLKNEYVSQYEGNVILWTDVVDWLTGFSEQMAFNPVSDPTLLNLRASAQERRTVSYITMLILPGLMLAGGLVVWWYRQR